MASLLYVFPHPDDESFGPAPALARQRRENHEVHLLTLTRGEATSQRERLGLSKDEMGNVRFKEMQNVARELDLSSLRVLDLPDGELDAIDPRRLAAIIEKHVRRTAPDVLITYPVHGISGHPDHLVSHAVVKHLACALRAQGRPYPKRLAFFTLPPAPDDSERPDHLQSSPAAKIGCVTTFTDSDLERAQAALHSYETYLPVIEEHQPLSEVKDGVSFELFGESHDAPLSDLTDDLPDIAWWDETS
ncbi:GlcNAc-PI de-N-acetylase [Longibacter salinarum]|uniref:GlcNAc-PI de-N-acetylase n=1 Tax=Longibacter salinarum TaxID=1850348 RepID=A0A2A8CVW3_9BACT|nr:PIG-L family deacetylase [Longibacter salinarum]PEN12786.1 GlcNAc-PI de-N-acetylase [Longibacter salinarum]